MFLAIFRRLFFAAGLGETHTVRRSKHIQEASARPENKEYEEEPRRCSKPLIEQESDDAADRDTYYELDTKPERHP